MGQSLNGHSLSVVGLFAGIGGLELGLSKAGHRTEMLCEIDPHAARVLKHHFPGVPLESDVREVRSIPRVDLVAAGFPCQDLSQAGRTAGISGKRSGLVGEVLRLVEKSKPKWVLLENVPFMLSLERGRAMEYLVSHFEGRGYRWAYRVVDTRSFGLPQRRRRVLFLASKTEDPSAVLMGDEADEPSPPKRRARLPHGFYWTEGSTGLGWAVDAVPTLKGGSNLGIPSPPAIWMPSGGIVTPDIRDAERLQGFESGWTAPSSDTPEKRNGPRWKLVGNAVSVPVAEWVGMQLAKPQRLETNLETGVLELGSKWPGAAFGDRKGRFSVQRSEWPKRAPWNGLSEFLHFEGRPLSRKATAGFLSRAKASSLRFEAGFLQAVTWHLRKMEAIEAR